VIVAVVVVGYTLVKRSRDTSTDAAWQTLRGLSFAPAEADGSFTTLNDLIEDAPNRDFKMVALLTKGHRAMSLALTDGFDPRYLNEAEKAYRGLLEEYSDRMAVAATVLRGLAIIEESHFAVDSDLKHRTKAEEYLNQLVNEPRFKGTPFQTDAARRLQEYDATFQVIAMAQPEPLPPAPLDVQDEPVVKDGNLELRLDRGPAQGAPGAGAAPETGEMRNEPDPSEPPADAVDESSAAETVPEAAADRPPDSDGG
jgi:hypothetical protein